MIRPLVQNRTLRGVIHLSGVLVVGSDIKKLFTKIQNSNRILLIVQNLLIIPNNHSIFFIKLKTFDESQWNPREYFKAGVYFVTK